MSQHDFKNYQLEEAVISRKRGVLRAENYDDKYFDASDGLAESRYVFINGNDLVKKLRTCKRLTIAETGFGTGLNFLAVLEVLDKFPDCHIDYISFEARPLSREILAYAHAAFPSLNKYSALLLTNLPPRWPGLHLRHFNQGRLRLHLYYGLAESCLTQVSFTADVWFLDGFSPAKNPEIWSNTVLTQVGRLTRPGGSLASFTAARVVSDRLRAAGFNITKRQGYGVKREMIIGHKVGVKTNCASPESNLPVVGIIGGGIAGASVAAGLRHRGIRATILDSGSRLATAASGNRLALQVPRLTVDNNDASQLSTSCLDYASHCADRAGANIATNVISLDWPEREASRQLKFRHQQWPDDLLRAVDASGAKRLAGVNVPIGGVIHDYGRVIEPLRLCKFLAGNTTTIFDAHVTQVARDGTMLVLDTDDGRRFSFDVIVLATGASLPETLEKFSVTGIRLEITSGQVSKVPEQASLKNLQVGLSYGGYLTPSYDGFHELGATFDRHCRNDFDEKAFAKNRDYLPPEMRDLFKQLDTCQGRTSQRASTPDHNPIMGRLDENIYVLGAVGARGFTLAPLLGEYLAAQISRMPNCLSHRIRAMIDPFRFRLRRGS